MTSITKYFTTVCYGSTEHLNVSTNAYELTQIFPYSQLIIDGAVVEPCNTVLLKDQIDPAMNGIYKMVQQGVPGITPFILRRICMNLSQKHVILIKDGDLNEETFWCADFDINPYTPGVTPQLYNKVVSVDMQEIYENSGMGPHIVLNTLNGCFHIADNDPALSECLLKITNNAGTVEYLSVNSDGICVDGGLSINETSTNPQPVVAGKGTLWIRDDSPNVLIYTDDDGNEFILNAGGGGSVTFLGLLDTPINYTGDANKMLSVNSGASSVTFSENLVGNNSDTTGTSIALANNSSVGSNINSIAIGAGAMTSANNTIALGLNARNDVSGTKTVNAISMINNTANPSILIPPLWVGDQTSIASGLINLSVAGVTNISLPMNTLLFVDQIDIVKSNVSATPGNATIDIGTSTNNSFFFSGLSFGGVADNILGRRVINTALLNTDGVSNLRIEVTSAGGSGAHNIRAIFKGYLLRNE